MPKGEIVGMFTDIRQSMLVIDGKNSNDDGMERTKMTMENKKKNSDDGKPETRTTTMMANNKKGEAFDT
jgi:hypothetical protein